LLDALVKAIDRPVDLLQVICESDDEADACDRVAELLGVTESDAAAILEIQARRFTRRGAQRIREERDHLRGVFGTL
jgi:DNA gyrase/topoisomerase IV subunit A